MLNMTVASESDRIVSTNNTPLVSKEEIDAFTSSLKLVTKDSVLNSFELGVDAKEAPFEELEELLLKTMSDKENITLDDIVQIGSILEGLDEDKLSSSQNDTLKELISNISQIIDNNIESKIPLSGVYAKILDMPLESIYKLNNVIKHIQKNPNLRDIKTIEQLIVIADKKGLNLTKLSIETFPSNLILNKEDKNILASLKGLDKLASNKADPMATKSYVDVLLSKDTIKATDNTITLKDLIQTTRDLKKIDNSDKLQSSKDLMQIVRELKKINSTDKPQTTKIFSTQEPAPIRTNIINQYIKPYHMTSNEATKIQDSSKEEIIEDVKLYNSNSSKIFSTQEPTPIKTNIINPPTDIIVAANSIGNNRMLTKEIEHNATSSSIRNAVEDLKEKLENFKPPLMKISIEINPQKLGKVDVDIISRGNSLYLNFNSNQQAVAMIANNLQEFKNSLSELGFNDVELNFASDENAQNQNPNNQEDATYTPIEELLEEEIDASEIDNINVKIPFYL